MMPYYTSADGRITVYCARWEAVHVFRIHARLKPGDLVFVPYGGSGPDIAAAVVMDLRLIWCEAIEDHCRAAVGARLHAVGGDGAGLAGLPLFGGAR
jgi:hypothetical protein